MTGSIKWVLIFSPFILTLNCASAKAQNDYHIVFYNVENLYDTFDDPKSDDDAFTPKGQNHWNSKRFNAKLLFIYKALIAASKGQYPDIIGLAEVENYQVLEQLITKTPFVKIPYGIIHKESPDPRGIDVAILYRKDRIKPVDYEHIKVFSIAKNPFVSRDILHFVSELDGNRLHLFINHWPSRSGGYNETKEKRNLTAGILRRRIDSLFILEPEARLLIMGDFNATPKETCFTDILKVYPFPGTEATGSLVNLSTKWLNGNSGTICREGQWEIFDQIICSANLLKSDKLKILAFETEICRQPFLLEPDLKYLGKKPFRTYLGPVYHGGVSDHLPVVTVCRTGE
jgi:endonuclease/exonuclease/phosphatase family metal-dependent hydrolase